MLALADAQPDLAALFDGSGYGPAPITTDEPRAETGLAAEALIDLFDPLLGDDQHDALLTRAPTDPRAHRLQAGDDVLAPPYPEGDAIPAAASHRTATVEGTSEAVSQYHSGTPHINK